MNIQSSHASFRLQRNNTNTSASRANFDQQGSQQNVSAALRREQSSSLHRFGGGNPGSGVLLVSSSNNNNNNNNGDDDDVPPEPDYKRFPKLLPLFEPDVPVLEQIQRKRLAEATRALHKIRAQPAVHIVSAPADPDRAPWRSCIVMKHDDPPPLDLRTEKSPPPLGEKITSPNAFLLQQERPRWVSIAQQRLATGCPSRGIPVQILEDPSSVSMREWGGGNSSLSSGRRHRHRSRGGISKSTAGSARSGRSVSLASSSSATATPRAVTGLEAVQAAQAKSLQQKRAEADAQESARSVGTLLHRLDSMAPGTRNHLQREASTLTFLRDASRAQSELKKIVAGEVPLPETSVLAESSRRKSQTVPTLAQMKRKQRQQQRQQQELQDSSRRTAEEGEYFVPSGDETFEDLVQIVPDRQPGESAVPKLLLSTSVNNNVAAAASLSSRSTLRLPDIVDDNNNDNNGSRRGSSMMIMMTSARSADQLQDGQQQQQMHAASGSQKLLVRLPKVGLQLFGTK